MHIKPLVMGGALTLLPLSAHAIVNVEQAIIGKSAEGIHTTVDVLANGSSGNSVKNTIKANALTLWKHEAHTEFLQVQYAYGKSRGQVDTNRAFAHLRHRTDISPAWGIEGFVQIGRDPFARLAQRTLLGGGVRYVLFEEDQKSAAYLGAGAFNERETRSVKAGTNDPVQTNLWRANTYVVFKQRINDQVRLYNTTYYQPAINNTADFRLLEQASMLVKLADQLDLKVSLDISFNSKPPQTVQKRDLFYSAGLAFSF